MRLARPRSRLRAAAALALLPALGCVGLEAVVRGSGRYAIERPALAGSSGRGGGAPLSAARLRAAWGEPREVERPAEEGPGTIWRYPTALRWHGVVLLVGVVPLPLLLPTGRHAVELRIVEERVVSARGSANATLARAGCVWGVAGALGRPRPCRLHGLRSPPAAASRQGALLTEGGPRAEASR